MSTRTVRTCDRCGHEIGPHVYRVEKAPNPAAPSKSLHFAPLPDLVDFCGLGCLLGYYGDRGEKERGLQI